MGYYIEVEELHNKCAQISEVHGATKVSKSDAEAALNDSTKAVIIVVDNGPFEAAAFAYDKKEWDAFHSPQDFRPHWYLTMDRALAKNLTGYNKQ